MSYKLGLIGYPLSHSFSPSYFQKKFEDLGLENCEYKAYPIATIAEVESIFDLGVTGLNVTIPYKEAILPYLDELSEEAFEIGAVNTIMIRNGRKYGYNTDIYGFEHSLLELLKDCRPEKALILGTGGAAKAVEYTLKGLGIMPNNVSRKSGFLNYEELDSNIMDAHKLIVNTTPLGMYPNVDRCPNLPYRALSDDHFLYDLVYNPEKTLFLKKGAEQGAFIKNGHDMLILQAEKAWTIWNQQ